MTVDQINQTQAIIRGVLDHHMIHKGDFFGPCREPHLVAARIDAAKQLRKHGLTQKNIAYSLRRSEDTIRYYLNPKMKDRKALIAAQKWPLAWLNPESRKVVCDYALAEETTPRTIIAQWINERAEHEARAKWEAVAA